MEKFLVTGVAGFIGYHFARELLQKGEVVVGVDNFCNSKESKDSNISVSSICNSRLCSRILLSKRKSSAISWPKFLELSGMGKLYKSSTFPGTL